MSKAKPRRPLLIELDATPGSSIGKFAPHEAAKFLSRIRVLCGSDGRPLPGMDLVEDKAVLEAAYHDPLGVTVAFNLNILNSVNRIPGSDVDVRQWRHVARYDRRESRIEMHLEAVREISVPLPDGPRTFRAGERIHTENSYKADSAGLAALMTAAGREPRCWFDGRRRFAVALG
jgi:uncharacterized SAM-dependent methyltransferase